MIFLDIEVYTNYFLICFTSKLPISGNIPVIPQRHPEYYEMYEGHKLDIEGIVDWMANNTTCGFNSLKYDLPILAYALGGATLKEIKALSDEVIRSKRPSWQIFKEHGIETPSNWDHIDIIEVAPGVASLKAYGGRMNLTTIQDLPYDEKAIITPDHRPMLIKYCFNDCDTTEELYDRLDEQLNLRRVMSKQYGIDLRSKSDAQMAEAIVKSELHKVTGKRYYKPDIDPDYTFKYKMPDFISFKTPLLQEVYQTIIDAKFTLDKGGYTILPDEIKLKKITIGDSTYKIGLGGLHSKDKKRVLQSGDAYQLVDMDITSCYPAIILQQKLSPKSMGEPFLKVYKTLVQRRITAKQTGNKVISDVLKISINGTFGKLGSKWSAFYAPDLLIQTTLTGQLSLLMLIESLELDGQSVASANTDGIVIKCTDAKAMHGVAFRWMLTVLYKLELSYYETLVTMNVNNYMAIKKDGIKTKGIFSPPSLSKNPDFAIVYEAVVHYFASERVLEDVYTVILDCKDASKFVSVRRVTGGAVWRNTFLGKAVRFYYSVEVPRDECIRYAKNANKVPKSDGGKPLMTMTDLPNDIDYQRYIDEAVKVIGQLENHT